MKLSVDVRQLQKLERHLQTYASKALPYAVRNGLNAQAFEARKEWVGQLGKDFTLRNTFTARSIRVVKSTARRTISSMESRVGSGLAYMAQQESGFTRSKRGKHGVPIPTTGASGQAKGGKRTRSIRRKNYLTNLSVAARVGGGRQRRNAVAIVMAAKTGGVAYLDLGRRKGLFRVEGRKKGMSIRMLYDLSKASTTTKAHPTMHRAIAALSPRMAGLQKDALLAELKKHRVLWYGLWGR